jgi:hypothetical protein
MQGLVGLQGPRGILILLPDMVIVLAHPNLRAISPLVAAILPLERHPATMKNRKQSREILCNQSPPIFFLIAGQSIA